MPNYCHHRVSVRKRKTYCVNREGQHPCALRFTFYAKRTYVLCGALVALLLLVPAVPAQVRPGQVGVGAWAGNQSGLAVKYYAASATAYEAMLSREDGQLIALNAHLLREGPVPGSPLAFFAGVGVFAGLLDAGGSRLTFGPSGSAGLNFFSRRFEIFLQAVPHLQLSPTLDARLGLGAGLRYYF
jgi:hypothetical protein